MIRTFRSYQKQMHELQKSIQDRTANVSHENEILRRNPSEMRNLVEHEIDILKRNQNER